MSSSRHQTGSQIISTTLANLKVPVIFGIVGIPVIEVAEACLAKGIRFISFRNEQAASYAATAYGYLTGRPGVCLVVGGPGVLHAVAGVGNATANAWPLLLLAGSSDTHQVHKGAFQELDAISYLAPHTKLAIRPSTLSSVPKLISEAYRAAFYGRPGPTFVDLPADLIQGHSENDSDVQEILDKIQEVQSPPKSAGDPDRIHQAAILLKGAKRPLVIVGKGACYARSENVVGEFIERTGIPFLPTPMGKGLLPDAHPLNTSAARSQVLASADVILVLGARLNWILHFGLPPKFSSNVKMIQVDICPEEVGRNGSDGSLGIVGDINIVVPQIQSHMRSYHYSAGISPFAPTISKNEKTASQKAQTKTSPMKYHQTFTIIQDALHRLTTEDNLVYVSEGANTMDISRSIFTVSLPRQRLDAGTYATMGVGLGYAIAAHLVYSDKKIIAIEGDSAFGFSLAEVETMTRYEMPVMIFVINNGGVYRGSAASEYEIQGGRGLKSTALGREVRYDIMAEGLGARGFLVKTPEELIQAVQEGFKEVKRPSVINILIEPGAANKLEFNWLATTKKDAKL